MGEFRRQPSKVWWLNFPEETDSKLTNFPDWGKSVDLSSNTSREMSKLIIGRKDASAAFEGRKDDTENGNTSEESSPAENNVEAEWQESKPNEWQNPDINANNRGCSSSPSQGSHKSQDSGFSDSEIHTNANMHSPQYSPELAKRMEPSNQEETIVATAAASVDGDCSVLAEQLNNIHLGRIIRPRSPRFNNYLETAFDGNDESKFSPKLFAAKANDHKCNSPVSHTSTSSIFNKIQKARTKNMNKISKIENKSDLSVKLSSPKRTTPTVSLTKMAVSQLQLKQQKNVSDLTTKYVSDNNSSNHSVIKLSNVGDKMISERTESQLDVERFKMPKKLFEQNTYHKGSDNFLNLTHIEGPPVSSSTPKLMKVKREESPTPKAATATEKIGGISTFATVRKLKIIPDKKMKRPATLFSTLNRRRKETHCLDKWESPVKHWLSELSSAYQAEIMTTLQSKSLATDLTRQLTNMAATTSETITKLHQKTKTISAEFSHLFKLKKDGNKRMESHVMSLIGHMKEFVDDFVKNEELIPESVDRNANEKEIEMVTDFRQEEPKTMEIAGGNGNEISDACDQLKNAMESYTLNGDSISDNLELLAAKFTVLVDMMLLTHVKALMRAVEEPKTELALHTALSALLSLNLEANVLTSLFARSQAVRALLAVCLEGRTKSVRMMALRLLTIVCSVSETIKQFERAGGLEIISDILGDEKRCEPELSETVAVLAQITAPWIKDNNSLSSLSHLLGDLVKSVTRIVKTCKSSEILLLSAAALANLTFMEPRTVWPLIENGTAKILLTAVRLQGPKVSVFIQEQAATVIANMASVPECRKHLAEIRAVAALLCFLQIRHSPFQRVPEIEAAERVQQKSAVALSRLCVDETVARQVVELQGVVRLVRLCKEERERNHSDAVLVACLAALRKIQANCGSEALDKLEAVELVEPRLLDSFLLYSSKQESYV